MSIKDEIKKVRDNVYEIPGSYNKSMRASGRFYIADEYIDDLEEGAVEQIVNVACLPGVQRYSIGLPDIHFGYGFPIGGVAAFSLRNGIVSPGGVGFDINCGVRLISDVLDYGAEWAVKNGYGWQEDLEVLEENGRMIDADSSIVSDKAKKRGIPQLGSLGSGNHFLEVQIVDEIYDENVAEVYGLREGMIVIMIHTGSRGCGHQIMVPRRLVEKNTKAKISALQSE